MIKQPFLPLKFYNELEEQQFRVLRGSIDANLYTLTEDQIFLPPFQIKRVSRANLITTFDLINFDDGTTYDLTPYMTYDRLDIVTADEDNITYDWIICNRFPIRYFTQPDGFYYLEISDDEETWYSEVFRLCDLYTNLVNNFTNSGLDGFSDAASGHSMLVKACESTGNGGGFYSNEFEVIAYEQYELFVLDVIGTLGACGTAVFGDDISWSMRESGLGVITDFHTSSEGINHIILTPTKTCTARLWAQWFLAGAQVGWQDFYIFLYNRRLDEYTMIEWGSEKNFCGILYNDDVSETYRNFDFYNHIKVPKANVILPTYEVDEEANENDEGEQAFLIQTLKKFYTLRLAGGHHMTDALALTRLHEDIEVILETGEILDICEFSMENSPITDYCERIELKFREAGCSVDSCDDIEVTECCCPTVENVLDYNAGGVGALPACGAGTDGDRYLALAAVPIYIYECVNGVGWGRVTDEEVLGNCVYDEDADASETYKQYWFWDENGAPATWWFIAQLSSVTDNTDGTATLNIGACQSGDDSDTRYFPCPVYIQAEYDPGTGFEPIGQAVLSDVADADGITVECGAGNFDFRIRYFTHNCELSYDGDINQTITDV